jgi:ribosomal protein S18 acetylase RimI-like enzyme
MNFHEVEANLRESFRVLAAGRPFADICELAGITIASLGVAFQMFNAGFFNSLVVSQADLEHRLEMTRRHFRSRNIPWALWVCEGWLAPAVQRRLTQTCERYGLRLSSELPGMMAQDISRPKRPLPALEVRRVESERTLADFRGIGSVCFHVPPPWFNEVFNESMPVAHAGFVCWVGYWGGVPVSTAATVAGDGVIGLYNIATAPEHRRTGFAEAITRHAIAAAADECGSARLVLQSTSGGFSLYERLGFRTVTRILVYSSAR